MNVMRFPSDLLEIATCWAERQSETILQHGATLDADGIHLARSVGVACPERICILQVQQIPFPDDPRLIEMARRTGFYPPHISGFVLSYGIFLRHGYWSSQVLSHEFRHVHQYEQAGSISAFLAEYLEQIMQFGYENAPLEKDARNYEIFGKRDSNGK